MTAPLLPLAHPLLCPPPPTRPPSVQAQAGAWNSAVLRVRLNTPGRADGVAGLGLNGQYREYGRMVWRKSADTRITQVRRGREGGRQAAASWAQGGGAACRARRLTRRRRSCSLCTPPSALQAIISTFFGGSWATPVDTHIDFANFSLTVLG